MKEIIMLEVNKSNQSQLVQDFLKQKNIDYRLLSETSPETNSKNKEELRKRLIAAYQREAKSKEFQQEMSTWESIAGDSISDE